MYYALCQTVDYILMSVSVRLYQLFLKIANMCHEQVKRTPVHQLTRNFRTKCLDVGTLKVCITLSKGLLCCNLVATLLLVSREGGLLVKVRVIF